MADDTVLSVDAFVADVKMLVEKDLCDSFEAFKRDLLQISKSKGLSSVKHKQIQQCTHQLLKLIKKHSKTNMHKFELYALKNIFATSVQGSHLASPQYQHCADAPSAELETLRARLADLSARNSFLREEAAASESLLGQMNKTIFDLRVGAQVLDTHDVKPLADAVSGAAQWHADLVQLSSRARQLTAEIQRSLEEDKEGSTDSQNRDPHTHQHPHSGGYGGGGAAQFSQEEEDDEDIDTIDAEDIRQLNDLLK